MKSAILALLITVLLRSQTPNETHPASSIRGKVINAITGEPLKNMPVTIFGDAFSRTALTGPDGEFVAKDLQPGIVQIRTQYPRFPGILGIDLSSVSMELKKGEDRGDVVVKLTPAGSISGTIRNDQNEPVQECSVGVESITTRRFSPEVGFRNSVETETNDQGEYRIENLPADRYFVLARCSESIPVQRVLSKDWDEPRESWLSVFFPDSQERSGATAVTVTPGNETSGIDFRLRRTRVGSLRGSLKYPASVRPSLLQLSLIPRENNQSEDPWPLGQMIQEDAREFHLQYIPPGLYKLLITPLNFEPATSCYATLDVQIDAGRTQTLSVEMQPGIVVHGELISATDNEANNSTLNERNWVVLSPAEAQARSHTAQIASDGTFTVNSLTPGKWTVTVGLREQNQIPQSITWGDREIEGNEILISESQTGPLRILVGPRTGGSVVGTLRKVAGAMGSDSELAQHSLKAYLYPVRDGRIDANRTPSQVAVSSGQFHVDHLLPGEYFAFAVNGSVRNVRPIANLMVARAETFFVQDGAAQKITAPVLSSDDIFQAALQYLQGSSNQH